MKEFDDVYYARQAKGNKKTIDDTTIIDTIYPIIESSISNTARQTSLKQCIGRFVHSRHEQLYDTIPCDRIFFKTKDSDDFFHSIKVVEKDVSGRLQYVYYFKKDELQACKDPFSIALLGVIRYYIKSNKNRKDIELLTTYLAFSGKFYASIHYKWFRNFVPKREVMEYVLNHMLTQKFDLVKTGSVWGAISSICNTWLDTYKKMFDKPTDEDLVYLIHQLYTRMYAFFRNIAKLYFEAYENKLYLNYESDNMDSENYRLSNTDSKTAEAITEKSINYITTTSVNLERCKAASMSGVNPVELKSIFETIITNNNYLMQLRHGINILITDFMTNNPNSKDITGIEFISYSIKMKPNTKNKDILQLKSYILGWLNTSERYLRTKTPATKNNYFRAILSYIALTINVANK